MKSPIENLPASSATQFSRGKAFDIIAWAFLITFVWVLIWPQLRIQHSPGADGAVFLYVANSWMDGLIPYKDSWDHKGPLLYLLNLIALKLGGGAWQSSSWLFLLLVSVGCCLQFSALSLFLRTRLNEKSARIAALIGTFISSAGLIQYWGYDGNYVEMPAFFVQSVAIFLFCGFLWQSERGNVSANNTEEPTPRLFQPRIALTLIGVCVGASLCLRPNEIVLPFLVGLFSLHKARYQVALILRFIAGILTLPLLFSLYFQSQGALAAMWESYISYNFAYARTNMSDRLMVLKLAVIFSRDFLSLVGCLGWICALIFLWKDRSQRKNPDSKSSDPVGPDAWRLVALFILLTTPLLLVAVSLSGRPYSHYFVSLIPILGMAGSMLCGLVLKLKSPPIRLYGLVLIAVFAFPTLYRNARSWRDWGQMAVNTEELKGQQKKVAIVNSLAPDGAPIYIWGHDDYLLLRSNRVSASRYSYQLPLFTPGYASEQRLNGISEELRQALINNNGTLLVVDEAEKDGNIGGVPTLDESLWSDNQATNVAHNVSPQMRIWMKQLFKRLKLKHKSDKYRIYELSSKP